MNKHYYCVITPKLNLILNEIFFCVCDDKRARHVLIQMSISVYTDKAKRCGTNRQKVHYSFIIVVVLEQIAEIRPDCNFSYVRSALAAAKHEPNFRIIMKFVILSIEIVLFRFYLFVVCSAFVSDLLRLQFRFGSFFGLKLRALSFVRMAIARDWI